MIYENICKMAKKRGISINKLEEKAGLSTGSICKWGKSVSPTVKSIKKVSDILSCTVDDLISEKTLTIFPTQLSSLIEFLIFHSYVNMGTIISQKSITLKLRLHISCIMEKI